MGAGAVNARSRAMNRARSARSAEAWPSFEHSSKSKPRPAPANSAQLLSAGPFLGEKFADLGNEFHGDGHRRVGSGFVGRFILCDGLLVRLLLVVFEDAANPFLVPAFRKFRLLHFFLRRLSAFSALGPRS